MLEIIIAIFPGIIAFLIYRRSHTKIHWIKLLSSILFYTLFTNLCILLGLYLIGMRSFNLFDMSISFKVKWLLLEFVLAALVTVVIINIRNLSLAACKHIFIRLIPAMLFFIVTYAIFTPSSLYFGNIKEFSLKYTHIVPILLLVSPILVLGIYLAALCLSNEKYLHVFIAVIFSISISLYVQGNFLNPELPTLDGTEVNWELYNTANIISSGFWGLCLVVCLAFSWFRKERAEKVMKYIAYFVSAVQLVSLLILVVTTKYDEGLQSGYAKDDMFTIGSGNNIIIFVVDTLQASVLEEYITSDVYEDGSLDDFTFFDNTVCGGAPTKIAMPLLLTGVEYDPTQSFETYSKDVWSEEDIFHDYHENGYNVCLFTSHNSLPDPPEGIVDNFEATGIYAISDYLSYSQQLYKLVNYYLMPQSLKQYFWLADSALKDLVTDGRYRINDFQFYADLQAAERLETKYEKAFRLYHLRGVHLPYQMNENAEYVEENVTEQQTLRGDIKIINEYIKKLKEADVYEDSTIVILGDHGRHTSGNLETNPAVLIKLPYETHRLSLNSAPIHFRNIVSSLAGTFLEDYSYYGPSIYDITENSDVERLHTVDNSIRMRTDLLNAYNIATEYTRLIIRGRSDDGDFQIWNPYEINCIRYQMGDVIDFTGDNHYADQIDYRLYKESGTAIASNELSICFELENIPQEDLKFHFIYSDLYNDSQKIRLYANGNKVENIICIQEGVGQENIINISKDYVNDGKLVLRMVFPNAVTPNQLDRDDPDTRVLSVAFTSMWLE